MGHAVRLAMVGSSDVTDELNEPFAATALADVLVDIRREC